MKVTVIKVDESVIYNGVIYKHGQSFEAAEAVGKSLIERGYVSPEGEPEAKGKLDKAQLEAMPYSSLKRLAADMGVSAVGNKETLIARLCAVEVGCEPQNEVDEAPEEDTPVVDFPEEEPGDDLPNTNMPD